MSELITTITLFLLPFIFWSIGYYGGYKAALKVVWLQALNRGFAEWVPDKQGNTTFKWKEVAK